MQKLFNKILVPVDFSGASAKAVDKAVLMANAFKCSITLIHAVSPEQIIKSEKNRYGISDTGFELSNYKDTALQLKRMAREASYTASRSIEINSVVIRGGWNEGIAEYINRYKVDLVIVCQRKHFFWKRKTALDTDRIAALTCVPVIEVPANRRLTGLGSIGIPVTDFLPVRKIMYGIYLANANNATLKLLGVKVNADEADNEYYLYKAYQLIRDNCIVKTELETIRGESAEAAVNEYVHNNTADLVIVNPDAASSTRSAFYAFLKNMRQRHSGSPVMTVTPL